MDSDGASGNNSLLMASEIAGIVAGGSLFVALAITYWGMANWEAISEFTQRGAAKVKDYEAAGVRGAQRMRGQVKAAFTKKRRDPPAAVAQSAFEGLTGAAQIDAKVRSWICCGL